jgi:hydroxymethylpyrimidine/phosphomethylpyrimidine kinase
VVLDTVMLAKSGDPLLSVSAVETLRQKLLPQVALITPNLPEAAALLNAPHARSEREMKEQGSALLAMGCGAVLMKGGHLDDAESPTGSLLVTEKCVLPPRGCRPKTRTARAVRSRRRWQHCVHDITAGQIRCRKPKPGSLRRWQKPILWKWVTVLGRFIIFMHGGKPYTGNKHHA